MKYDKDRHTHIAGCVLTFGSRNGIVPGYGEMSERFKEPVLKTGDGATHRGFESHSLRHEKSHFCLLTKVTFFNDIRSLRNG